MKIKDIFMAQACLGKILNHEDKASVVFQINNAIKPYRECLEETRQTIESRRGKISEEELNNEFNELLESEVNLPKIKFELIKDVKLNANDLELLSNIIE